MPSVADEQQPMLEHVPPKIQMLVEFLYSNHNPKIKPCMVHSESLPYGDYIHVAKSRLYGIMTGLL